MKIKLYVKDVLTGEVLEELGICICDNPNRAVQMYDADEIWCEKGYTANIVWKDITDDKYAMKNKDIHERLLSLGWIQTFGNLHYAIYYKQGWKVLVEDFTKMTFKRLTD